MGLATFLAGLLVGGFAPTMPVLVGGACLVAGLVGLAVCLHPSVPLRVWFVASAVSGFGIGTAYSPLSVVTLELAEPGREVTATSALQLTDILGTAFGTGAAGVVVAVGDRVDATRSTTLAVLFLGAAVVGTGVVLLSGRLPSARTS